MLANRIRGIGLIHTCVLAFASALLFWGWLAIIVSLMPLRNDLNGIRYLVYCCVVVAAFGIDFVTFKVRKTDLLNLHLASVLRLSSRQTLTVVVTLLFFLVAAKDQMMSRTFLFTFIPALYGMLFFSNRFLPPILVRFLFRGGRRERALLVGDLSDSERIVSWCQRKAHYGLDVVGLVSNNAANANKGIPLLGSLANLETVIQDYGVTQVVSLSLPNSIARFVRLAALCDRLGVRLVAINDLQRCFHRPISYFRDEGFQFISLRREPLECPLNRVVKRAVDIALALPVVVLVLPLLSLGVFALHKFQSPGPLLFRQRRTGMGAERFMIYKFRTMHVNHGAEAQQATKNDTRIFEAGRWLRKLSLDEMPQFLNVLKGDMSIVGPRPHMPEHDYLFAKMANEYPVRNLVKPGITGLAQVRGFRGEATTDADVIKRVESDVYYLENWSLLMESMIIARTAWHMVAPPRSAY